MIEKKNILSDSPIPLYRQVAMQIIKLIEEGALKKNDLLPSVNVLQRKLGVSRVTIVNTYGYLRGRGIIESRHGKGYFVARETGLSEKRIFLLFDAMNSYKEILYKSFMAGLGDGFIVDVYFHYYNLKQFRRFIESNFSDYDYYVIIPHFNTDVSEILLQIPDQKLMLLDGDVPQLIKCRSIFQDFRNDVINAFEKAENHLKRYDRFYLVRGFDFQFIPDGIINGFSHFFEKYGFRFNIIKDIDPKKIKSGDVFMVFTDNDLITIVQYSMENNLKLGKDIGLISYDDTPLKSVLANGITTISTDFAYMGNMAAKMIKENIQGKFKNPSGIIIRNSL